MPSEHRVLGADPEVYAMTFQREPVFRKIQSGPLKV